MLTLPIPLPDPCRNVAPAIAPPTVRQDCDQLQANESRLPLRVIHDPVEPQQVWPCPQCCALRRAVLFVRTPRNNLQIGIRQRPLQRLGLSARIHTYIAPALSGSP